MRSPYNLPILGHQSTVQPMPYLQVPLPALPSLQVSKSFWIASSLSLALFYLAYSSKALGQIVPDGTLSTNVTTPDNLNFTINDGNQAGNNLFHSFREFSVPTGGEAFFNNPVDIQNIFSRVTGNSISNIDGSIGANGTANLFLINPNGIIFGPNAKLNVGGSFLGSTANSIKFGDGVEFSAINPQSSALLSINVPIGLQYGNNPREIRVQGKGQEFGVAGTTQSFNISLNPLEVLPGKSLVLVGGNVIIDGGIIQVPGGRVELVGIAGEGTVGINADSSLSFPKSVARADISIINKAGINVLARGGGSITITGRNIDISGDSLLIAGIAKEQGTPESIAGDISLSASENIAITSSGIGNIIGASGIGNSGDINISAKSVNVSNGTQLVASTSGKGNAGSISIVANDTVSFEGATSKGSPSAAASFVNATAVGNGGEISIIAKSVNMTDGLLFTNTLGKGNAGNISIVADDTVSFDSVAPNVSLKGIFSTVGTNAVGNAGDISITAKSLNVTNGAQLNASTFAQGNAGKITIVANDTVSFDGVGLNDTFSGAVSRVGENAVGDGGGVSITAQFVSVTNEAQIDTSTLGKGNAGGINITTKSLSVLDGSLLSAFSGGQGNGGSVTIVASDSVSFDGEGKNGLPSGITNWVSGEDTAVNGGGISITTNSLSVTNGAQLNASTFGRGNAGSIAIQASDSVSFDGKRKNGVPSSAISKVVGENAVGNAGDISIISKFLFVTNGAELSATTSGQGDGGSIKITTDYLSVTNGAQLITSTRGKGDAGSITIVASDTVSFDGVGNDENKLLSSAANSSVLAESAVGNAGGISITAKSVFVTNGAQLDASTFGQGNAGSINVVASDTVSFDGEGSDGSSSAAFGQVFGDNAVGNAGGINITAKSVFVTNGAQLDASTYGQGNAGRIAITASDRVILDGERSDGFASGVFSLAFGENSEGDAGGIDITTKSLFVTNGARLNANTLSGKRDAGSINIVASDTVIFDGESKDGNTSSASSLVGQDAIGNAGGITITTNSLSVTNGAQLNASTVGKGNAGGIAIFANDRVIFDGESKDGAYSGAYSILAKNAIGNAGGISITAKSLFVTNGAGLDVTTAGQGNGGTISIVASDTVSFDGESKDGIPSRAGSLVGSQAVGDSGGVNITTNSLFLTNKARLDVSSKGNGGAGNLEVNANTINLDNQAEIRSNTIGGEGNIKLQASSLILRRNSGISTNAQGENIIGGNIIFNTDVLAALENSDISANSINSKGGNVTINAQSIFGAQPRTRQELQTLLNTDDPIFLNPKNLPSSDITATGADSSLSGTISVNTPDVDPASGLIALPTNLVDATKLVASTCRPKKGEQDRFIVTGRGGLPPNPLELLPDKATWLDLRPRLVSGNEKAGDRVSGRVAELSINNHQIVEAQGWVTDNKGEVILVAETATATPINSGFLSHECGAL